MPSNVIIQIVLSLTNKHVFPFLIQKSSVKRKLKCKHLTQYYKFFYANKSFHNLNFILNSTVPEFRILGILERIKALVTSKATKIDKYSIDDKSCIFC